MFTPSDVVSFTGPNGAIAVSSATLVAGSDNLVIAAGPWTGPLSKPLLPTLIPIISYTGHSLIIRPSVPISEDCLFMSLAIKNSSCHPELFPQSFNILIINE